MEVVILFGRVPMKNNPRDARAAASAAGRALLQRLLADTFPGETVEIAKTDLGKPFLPTHPEVGVSISHSGDLAVAALGPGEIGIDLERIREPSYGVMGRCFTREERDAVDAGGGEVFTRIWTQKEALGKALGTGIADRSIFTKEARKAAVERDLAFCSVATEKGYVCTLAAEEEALQIPPKCAMIKSDSEK